MRRNNGDKKLTRTGRGRSWRERTREKELMKNRGGLESDGNTQPERASERAARLGRRGSSRKRAVKSKRFEKSGHKRARGKRIRKKNEGERAMLKSKERARKKKRNGGERTQEKARAPSAARLSLPLTPCMVWPGKCRPAAAFMLFVL